MNVYIVVIRIFEQYRGGLVVWFRPVVVRDKLTWVRISTEFFLSLFATPRTQQPPPQPMVDVSLLSNTPTVRSQVMGKPKPFCRVAKGFRHTALSVAIQCSMC
jgi:hypothetical protein